VFSGGRGLSARWHNYCVARKDSTLKLLGGAVTNQSPLFSRLIPTAWSRAATRDGQTVFFSWLAGRDWRGAWSCAPAKIQRRLLAGLTTPRGFRARATYLSLRGPLRKPDVFQDVISLRAAAREKAVDRILLVLKHFLE
jgi:hypothetical protein